jgi:hypothetical protein
MGDDMAQVNGTPHNVKRAGDGFGLSHSSKGHLDDDDEKSAWIGGLQTKMPESARE